MRFTEFQSLVNENPKSIGPILMNQLSETTEFYYNEKIHGANFSLYLFSDGTHRFASRNQFLGVDSVFFQYQRAFNEDFMRRCSEMAKAVIEDGYCYRFIGELFGGHDAVGIKPVQKDIRYDGDIQFRVFRLEKIKLDDNTIQYASYDCMANACRMFQLAMVEVIGRGPLREVYVVEADAQSQYASAEGQIREGIVFHEVLEGWWHDDQPLVIKKRSSNFLENKGKKSARKSITLDPQFVELFEKVIPMACEQRVSNVNSHFGFNSIQNFSELMKACMEDIAKDALAETGIDINLKDLKPLRSAISFELTNFIRKELM